MFAAPRAKIDNFSAHRSASAPARHAPRRVLTTLPDTRHSLCTGSSPQTLLDRHPDDGRRHDRLVHVSQPTSSLALFSLFGSRHCAGAPAPSGRRHAGHTRESPREMALIAKSAIDGDNGQPLPGTNKHVTCSGNTERDQPLPGRKTSTGSKSLDKRIY